MDDREHLEFDWSSAPGHDADIRDVVQEAADATSTRYSGSPETDVEQALREELSSRGVSARDDDAVRRLATRIRSGHGVDVGRPDGSVD